jgi:hypothetical protein
MGLTYSFETELIKKTNTNINNLNNLKKIESLETLECTDEYFFRQTNIQKTLKKIIITQSGIILNDNLILEKIILPDFLALEELFFDYDNDYELESFYIEYLKELIDNLPPNLKILKLPSFFNYQINNLPTKLEKIYLGIKFNQSLDFLPESIKYIEFVEGMEFTKSIDNLPSQLEYLNLQFQNKCMISLSNLPNSIKYLEIGEYELKIEKLPSELLELIIASPIKFNFVKSEMTKVSNDMKNLQKRINYYKLDLIGIYNIKNKIIIQIPPNLNNITWYNSKSSVYNYKKCLENGLWFEYDNDL